MRLIDAHKLTDHLQMVQKRDGLWGAIDRVVMEVIDRFVREEPTVDAASPWHRVEDELPKEAGEYIVAYHPCYWEDVDTSVTKVGIDNFRGKSAWAKKKFQRVTHWMDKPEPPKEGV